MSIFYSISLEPSTCTFAERIPRGVPTLLDQMNVLILTFQHIKLDQVANARLDGQAAPYVKPYLRTFQWTVLLEVLNRVPTTEVLRPFAMDLLKLCMHVLQTDDEVDTHSLPCLYVIPGLIFSWPRRTMPSSHSVLSWICTKLTGYLLPMRRLGELETMIWP